MKFRKDGHARPRDDNRLDPTSVDVGDRGPVLPLVLLLDTSFSMRDQAIEMVNQTLAQAAGELQRDPSFRYMVRVATITFGYDGVLLWRGDRRVRPGENPFVEAAEWRPPALKADGVTPMVEAIELAVRCVEEEKQRLRERRRHYYRSVMWMLTDGMPTKKDGEYDDSWVELLPKLSRSQNKFRLYALYPPSIPSQGLAALDELAAHAWPLTDFSFKDVLPLMSASMRSASSDPNAQDDVVQQTYDAIVMDRLNRR